VLPNLRNSLWQIDIVDISELKPYEEIYIEHVCRLLRNISVSVLVDMNSMAILNEDHRNDSIVKVYSWRDGYMATKYDVLYKAKTGLLYPSKTSRYVTSFEIPRIDLDISLS